jgi:hypothetical protein
MKLKDYLYKTPEMTEEKLIELLDKFSPLLRKEAKDRLNQLHKGESLSKALLKEYDLIQDKKSHLSKSQRNQIIGFVGMCMIQMTKEDES